MRESPETGRGRGGRDGHEPPSRIHEREVRAMELAVQGWSQRRMAAELSISQPAVSKLLRRVEERMLRELAEDVERQKARQTLRLEHLYGEAVRGWEQSKTDATRRRRRKPDAGAGRAGTTVAELVVENQHSDPRFLEQGRKALADLRTLWGLDAPQKVDMRATRLPSTTSVTTPSRSSWTSSDGSWRPSPRVNRPTRRNHATTDKQEDPHE